MIGLAFSPDGEPESAKQLVQQVRANPAVSNNARNSSGVFQPIHPGSASRPSGALSALNLAGPELTVQ